MSDINLTKDSDALICAIYKDYLEKRKNGISKNNCKHIGSSEDIQKTIVPEWSFEDVEETCRELDRAQLLSSVLYVDDTCDKIELSDKAIIYMENRFGNTIDKIVDYISKLKP